MAHPHTPVDPSKNGSIALNGGWFNYSGQYCDFLAGQLGRDVSKANLCQAFLQLLYDESINQSDAVKPLMTKVKGLIAQMPVAKRGRQKQS